MENSELHPCNDNLGIMEEDLLIRIAHVLDPTHPASEGLYERAKRAIDPTAARDEGDRNARAARRKRFLESVMIGDAIPDHGVYPGLGDRWNQPVSDRMAITVPKLSLERLTEKIVRAEPLGDVPGMAVSGNTLFAVGFDPGALDREPELWSSPIGDERWTLVYKIAGMRRPEAMAVHGGVDDTGTVYVGGTGVDGAARLVCFHKIRGTQTVDLPVTGGGRIASLLSVGRYLFLSIDRAKGDAVDATIWKTATPRIPGRWIPVGTEIGRGRRHVVRFAGAAIVSHRAQCLGRTPPSSARSRSRWSLAVSQTRNRRACPRARQSCAAAPHSE
jgi:hypothetical protein